MDRKDAGCGVGVLQLNPTPHPSASTARPLRSLGLPVLTLRALALHPYILNPPPSVAITASIVRSGVIPMAEVAGLVASITGIVGFAANVCKLCYGYYGEVKDARKDIEQLVTEISSLADLLEPLSIPAEASKIQQTPDSDSMSQLVHQFTEILKQLQVGLHVAIGLPIHRNIEAIIGRTPAPIRQAVRWQNPKSHGIRKDQAHVAFQEGG